MRERLRLAKRPLLEFLQKPFLRALKRLELSHSVDDATGYTKVRARDELQAILAAYISAELLPWAKRFPNSF